MKRLLKILSLTVGTWAVLGTVMISLTPQLRHRMIRDLRFLARMRADNDRAMLPAPRHPSPSAWRDDELTAAWLGHATMLINWRGVWILTDPIFSDHAGPNLGNLVVGPKRYVAPALTVKELPRIDLIILSHAHFDHTDMRSLAQLARHSPRATVITAAKTADLLDGKKFARVEELAWGGRVTVSVRGEPLTVTALPVKHWGARWRRDTWRGYNGYLLERDGQRVVFSGDTAYTPVFASLAGGGGVDLMFVPIGAYDPWIASHCSPEEAVQMASEAAARHVFPMHFATFKLSAEPMDEPLRRFRAAIEPSRSAGGEIGGTFVLPRK
ncbi:MAG: MBL fold metallo-hydrolase [Verrucomicrobiales bacterium]|jgi:L-ascorbate metabolism protein UlaG (beta-lactamase superfamily)|nr:MBL fold metallo-hydrolase [Verrucomicrobiales bacterium]